MRAGKQESIYEGSELTRIEKTDQATERGTNQHLLIALGVPGGTEQSVGKAKKEEKEGRETTAPTLVKEYKGVS